MAPTEPIEAQAMSDYSDADSGYDEKTLSTASVRSSIYDYEQENGRSYHAYKAGKYVLPNVGTIRLHSDTILMYP